LAAISLLAFTQKRQQDNAADDINGFERFFASAPFAVIREADRVEVLPVDIVGAGISSTHQVLERPVSLDPATVRDLRRRIISVNPQVPFP
jgi:hypothetical protein